MQLKMLAEKIKAKGHINVTARHKTTLEITTDNHLTLQGDCIIAISANRSLPDLSSEFREKMKDKNSRLEITLMCLKGNGDVAVDENAAHEKIIAYGHPDITLTHPTDMVVRKSRFVCSRTLAILADKAAIDLNREFIEKLRNGGRVTVELNILKNSNPKN